MNNIVVLFNLKEGVDASAYEAWAASTDLPIVNGLSSINKFEVFKTTGLLGSDAPAPYQYVELLAINDFEEFGQQVSTDTCLLYTSPSPRDLSTSRMPSSA